MQLHERKTRSIRPRGMVGVASSILRREGPTALWRGLGPALVRQCSYTGLTYAMYNDVLRIITGESAAGDISFGQRALAGGIAGGLGIFVCNPAEVVKTLLQADRKTGMDQRSVPSTVKRVWRSEGLGGFWAGWSP